ncbi:MAG: EcsC family protein [Proteobacteria bacterium]|nr:MAG: EcsC family protein [Pseudomonadota bacterium]
MRFIEGAAAFLEKPSFVMRTSNLLGKPIEMALERLPEKAQSTIQLATRSALEKALGIAISSLERSAPSTFANALVRTRLLKWGHTGATTLTGAIGGFFGLAALPVELPITTAVILRSIASIADEYGIDLSDPRMQMECLYIFSLGSPKSSADDGTESAYLASRAAFAKLISDAAAYLATHAAAGAGGRALEAGSSPAILRLLTRIAAQFEIVVSEKALAEALPVVGALGGGAINALFTDYFGEAARCHFGLLALEKSHGGAAIHREYKKAKAQLA